MTRLEITELSEFSRAVRESTLKRLKTVPPGKENWRITAEAMSFADLAKHLIDADNWLLRKLEVKSLAPMCGESNIVKVKERGEYLVLLDSLKKTEEKKRALIENLTENQLNGKIFDKRFGKKVSVWWIIVRGNLDHEIHHRGQIAAYLQAIRNKM